MSTAMQDEFNKEEGDNEDKEFAPLPPGTYECKLLSIKEETNPFDPSVTQTTLEYEVSEGTQAKRRIWDTVKHLDSMAWKAVRIFRSLGLTGTTTNWGEWGTAIRPCEGRNYTVTTVNKPNQDGSKVYTNITRATASTILPPF